MKLRNKKTGEIGDLIGSLESSHISICIDYHKDFPIEYSYDSIEKLNEEWEDHKPKEIIIKDEEIISFMSLLERVDRKLSKLCGEKDYIEYKGLYESELRRNRDMDGMRSRKDELEAQVERLTHKLNSCEDRISDMAQENASLKEQIKALEKPALKKPAKKGKNE